MPERKARKRAGTKRIKGERRRPQERKRGPSRWLEEGVLSIYVDAAQVSGESTSAAAPSPKPISELSSGGGATDWHSAFKEYRRRKEAVVAASAMQSAGAPTPGLGAPTIPGAANWLSLGPLVVMDGQTGGGERQPVAGRVAGLAIGPGGNTIYAASANGGVFLSTNGAGIWKPTDEIDLDPNSPASASLICGAIAIDPMIPNRLFVGTGEGATYSYFLKRITGALPAYRGIGILRTDDGGSKWVVEPSSPDLSGQAFFALAISPTDRECVVGATTAGLYRRVAKPGGEFEWVRVEEGVFSSVVVASAAGGVTRFFCARWPQDSDAPNAPAVLWSEDGKTWKPAGEGFPPANVGRISLGLRAGNPDQLYALVARSGGLLHGLYRLDAIDGNWQPVAGLPKVLPSAQGNYDLAIAVDPEKESIVYLGGSYEESGGASIWRCNIQKSGTGYSAFPSALVGQHAHSDVHVLIHSPNNPNELWCGCDGGVFLNRDPRGGGKFAAQNIGLACLCCNFFAQHPTDPSIIITGLQDNGTALKDGSIWRHVQDGDGGYCVINWADPNQVLVFMNGGVYRSVTGGKTHQGWTKSGNWGWKTMTQPIVGVPSDIDSASAADANLVAVGVGNTVTISTDFGASWPNEPSFKVPKEAGDVFALAFASRTRLFVGTTDGQVFRADNSATGWTARPCEGGAGGHLGIAGVITDIVVDWADRNLESIYVAFGSIKSATAAGTAASSRVWWFDGKNWHARSGTPPNNLLNVEHNALAFDRQLNHLYAGADIGVWHSADGGQNWALFQNGLPDAPVFDLQIHPTQRLLRAATHGRGMYEIPI
jgi:hypothetical protein